MFGIVRKLRPRLTRTLGLDPVVFIERLYAHFAGRRARPSEVAYQMGRLAAGLDPNDLLAQFIVRNEEGHRPIPLYVPLGHHCSPLVDPEDIRARFTQPHDLPETLAGIDPDRAGHEALWQTFLPLLAEAPFTDEGEPGFRYRFDNPAFGHGDALLYYAMLRHVRPARVIEIGSGHSSALLLDVAERFLEGRTRCTFVEPFPDLVKSLLGPADLARHQLIAQPVQDVPLDVFRELAAGDMLFIDSSHLLKSGADTNYELFEILPALAPGVLIHIHDIFYPFEYPSDWVLEENRSWNEAYALRAFLMFNPEFEIVFFNDYFARFCRPLIEAGSPLWARNTGGSLWIRKKARKAA